MASSIACFKKYKNQFTAEERKALRLESRKLAIEKKIPPKDAMVQVITAHRDELQAEYDKIADVVMKHYKMPEKKAVPKKKTETFVTHGAFGSTERARKASVEIAKAVQKTKQENQTIAYNTLSKLSKKDLDNMDVDALDRLLADITQGPGNFHVIANWKKEHFVERLLEKKVEAPKAKKELEVISEEDYLAQKGAGRQEMGEAALHKNIQPGRAKEDALKRQAEKDSALIKRRDELREEYKAKVAAGEIREPTRTEALIKTANGHPDVEATQAARRLLKKRGVEWEAKAEPKAEAPKTKPKKAVPKKKATSQVELVKRYVKETGEKVEKGELGKVKEKYPEEWAEIEKADAHKKELWNKLPEDFRKNRGINEYTTEELKKKLAKEPWETSDLANRPNIPASYVQAKKQANGKYKLFFTGTTSEVFEGELFASASEARSFFKVQQAKAQEATSEKEAISKKKAAAKKIAGQRSDKVGVEFYNPFYSRSLCYKVTGST